MTNSNGHPVTDTDLNGKVWVADFIYTNCPAECPRMSSKMRIVAEQVKNDADVRLVSISVDPGRDTPAALTDFARHYGAPTGQWMFLTGTPDTVHLLAYATFHVGDVLGKIEHSTKFAVVDKQGDIRGYYSSFDKDDLAKLVADVEALRKERS